jgi:hypothetical protein
MMKEFWYSQNQPQVLALDKEKKLRQLAEPKLLTNHPLISVHLTLATTMQLELPTEPCQWSGMQILQQKPSNGPNSCNLKCHSCILLLLREELLVKTFTSHPHLMAAVKPLLQTPTSPQELGMSKKKVSTCMMDSSAQVLDISLRWFGRVAANWAVDSPRTSLCAATHPKATSSDSSKTMLCHLWCDFLDRGHIANGLLYRLKIKKLFK